MIVEVNHTYYYNAPASTKVGDRLRLPHTLNGEPTRDGEWIGTVTAAPGLPSFSYSGTIAAALGKVQEELRATVRVGKVGQPWQTFTAPTRGQLAAKVGRYIRMDDEDDLEW